MNDTIRKFGHPDTLLGDYEHWVVLLRPDQITAGSLVLACKGKQTRLPDVPEAAFAELRRVTSDLEAALTAAFEFDKINYVMLMMVDPHVHWHVIPRYAAPREVGGMSIEDKGWPGHPTLREPVPLSKVQFGELLETMRAHWPAGDR